MASDMSEGCPTEGKLGTAGRTKAVVRFGRGVADPRSSGSNGGVDRLDLTLGKIEQAVRGEDQVCPFGTFRVAIAFGPTADGVSPRVLADRLARAVRRGAAASRAAVHRSARAPEGELQSDGARGEGSSATITVDRMPSARAARGDAGHTTGPALPPAPTLRRRTVVRCSSGPYGTRHDDIVLGDRGTVLVVSPSRTPGGTPGWSAIAASTVAERLGFRTGTVTLSCDEELVIEVLGEPVDRVVLVLEGDREPSGNRTTWASSSWHIPAQLTANYRAAGIDVLAMGAGGGAGALASCVAQGAAVALDLDELQSDLEQGFDGSALDDPSSGPPFRGSRIPHPMEALVLLTASERRVLFYLTTGRSAQDIAEDLVVSVTTVRSHIRSILRKLGVRSQLAAVAIANSQDFERKEQHPGPSEAEESSKRPRGKPAPLESAAVRSAAPYC